MKNMLTTHTLPAMPLQARTRTSTGAFPSGRRAADLVVLTDTGACISGYTPAVVDVVQQDDFVGDLAWSPPV